MSHWLQIVVAAPAHSAIGGPLTYRSDSPLVAGTLVRVPFGRREVLGVVWAVQEDSGGLAEDSIRSVAGALAGLAPLSSTWRRLVGFTAGYYQRSLGEVALAALPPQLRDLTSEQLARRLKRPVADTSRTPTTTELIALSAEQAIALAEFDAETAAKQRPALLFGATGSGKTEVYLRAAAKVLAQDPQAQVLVMVPEINLTPQLQARFEARFAHLGRERVVPMHSGLTPAQRLKGWLAAHSGQARLVLGTRMAIFASMPNLRLLVVDEEHDPSYKQQEGARYSARDLAVYRARLETSDQDHQHGACRVLLGSATPSLESWQATLVGRYQRLTMNERIGAPTLPASHGSLPLQGATPPEALHLQAVQARAGGLGAAAFSPGAATPPAIRQSRPCGRNLDERGQALAPPEGLEDAVLALPEKSGSPGNGTPGNSAVPQGAGHLPTVRRIDMNHQPRRAIIAPPLLAAIAQRVARGEQSLIFLNRRGYAPVLACLDCDWKSECPHCSAYRVFHKIDRTLRCHHCGFTERVPHACPQC
ncbi:MAG: primosomal protein, partial [Polaromonas sp.]|nr:primosomal protein [Polaromonas sp.]